MPADKQNMVILIISETVHKFQIVARFSLAVVKVLERIPMLVFDFSQLFES